MADRKQFLNVKAPNPELIRALEKTRHMVATEEQLREQRISFAYGNALGSESVTKDRVRLASQYMSLENRRAAEAKG